MGKDRDLIDGKVLKTGEKITEDALRIIRGRIDKERYCNGSSYGGAGTVGKSGVLEIEAATNQAVCCIDVDRNLIDPEFLQNYLVFIRPEWMSHAIGTRKDPNIGKGIVANRLIPIPPISIQVRIQSVLKTIQKTIDAQKYESECLDAVFCSMIDSMMTGKTRMKEGGIGK